MMGWAISIMLMITWLQTGMSDPNLMIAGGLFAIAGSVGYGLKHH